MDYDYFRKELERLLPKPSHDSKGVLRPTKDRKAERNAQQKLAEDLVDIFSVTKETPVSVDRLDLQSTDSPDMAMDAVNSATQNIEFTDATDGEVKQYTPSTDKTFDSSHNIETELGNYLSRPVLIYSDTWTENNDLNQIISPWTLFFNDDRIRRKIDNYAFLSCNLKVKLMINASPFYYGCGLMSYQPLSVFEAGNVAPASAEQLFGVYSQRPHVYFYPQSNQGGELTLPFINYKDWLEATSITDLNDFGELSINTLGTLLNANSVTGTGVSVQIYAWAENVKLAGNTLNLALQSKDEYEEHNGVISKPASAIARAMGMLDSVPVIGPYMQASSFVTSKFADVAAWFGYTNTPVIESVVPFSGRPFQSYSSPEISNPAEKLVMDPKNELTIDPSVTGCDMEDHMLISNIVQREAFLFQTSFDSTTALQAQVMSIRVNPFMHNTVAAANSEIVQFTPMGHLSQMFKYWRGDLIYRFQFICSKYHRGRVRLTWDPTTDPFANPTTSTSNYTKIVDFAQTPNFELRVPYQQSSSYKLVDRDFSAQPPFIEGEFPLPVKADTDNGVLNMRIFTELTSPVANSPCLVFVSVRAAENFEFSTPAEVPNDIFVYQVQSEDCAIESTQPEEFFKVADDSNRNLVYHGEALVSLRQLLRRMCLTRTISWPGVQTASNSANTSLHPRLPYYPGFDPNGIHLAISPIDGLEKRYNYVNNTPFTWVRHCYVGHRGSIKWLVNNVNSTTNCWLGVRRSADSTVLNLPAVQTSYSISANSSQGVRLRDMLLAQVTPYYGGVCATQSNNWNSAECVAPMYSRFRMLPNNPATASFGQTEFDTNTDAVVTFNNPNTKSTGTSANQYNNFYEHSSIGPDFSFIYYINVPTMYRYSIPSAAANQPYTIFNV